MSLRLFSHCAGDGISSNHAVETGNRGVSRFPRRRLIRLPLNPGECGKLKLRIHLGAFLLQWLYNLTDRQADWAIKDHAAYQLFCGRSVVDHWRAPDHTKIEEFRSRLSPETQRQVANQVAVWATELGFTDPSKMDIDSTIQAANIAYPSDAQLMVTMTLLVNKVWTYMKQNVSFFTDFIPSVDVKAVKAKARAYLFRDRQDAAQAQT